MIDSNERLTFLNSRNTNKLVDSIIETTLNAYIDKKNDMYFTLNPNLLEERKKSIKNALFLKYCGIEFEGIFQLYFNDRKMD